MNEIRGGGEERSNGIAVEKREADAMSEKDSEANVPKPCGEYKLTPYFERFLGVLGIGDISALASAYAKFDKQELTSIHNKAAMYLTHPQIGEVLGMHNKPEKSYQGTQEALKDAEELAQVSLKDLEIGKRNKGVVLYGELCVEPFKFFRIYTLLEEVGSECMVSLSIVSADALSIDQSYARKKYSKGMKIALRDPMLVQ
ncbi:hypothetical protein KI387_021181, partial [Taxus chinensis]